MKAVVIGEGSGATMETIMGVYPRHKAVVDVYKSRGEVIGIGPFLDRGNMAIFRSREAAEAFVKEDRVHPRGHRQVVCHPRLERHDARVRPTSLPERTSR